MILSYGACMCCDAVEGIACLRGFSDASWVLRVHWKTNAIPKAPKPTFGINFTDGMDKDEWLHLVAKHSDSWLLAEACFKASESQFQPAERCVFYFSSKFEINCQKHFSNHCTYFIPIS